MMDFVTVEKGRIMAEYIACRRCDSPDCKGCNLKRLETMLGNGKFDCLMNENRAIDASADVELVRNGRWIMGTGENGLQRGHRECSRCGEIVKYGYSLYGVHIFCNYCGAKMDEEVISGSSGD